MDISAFSIYLWQQADTIIDAMGGIIPAMVLLTIIFHVIAYETGNNGFAFLGTWITPTVAILAVAVIVLMPRSKTVAMMVVIPAIAHSKVIQTDLPEIYDMAIHALKAQLSDKKQ